MPWFVEDQNQPAVNGTGLVKRPLQMACIPVFVEDSQFRLIRQVEIFFAADFKVTRVFRGFPESHSFRRVRQGGEHGFMRSWAIHPRKSLPSGIMAPISSSACVAATHSLVKRRQAI